MRARIGGFDWAPGQGRPVIPGQTLTFCEDVRGTVMASHDRDLAWAARELGDVPYDRVIGASAHDNPIVWVESLGREG